MAPFLWCGVILVGRWDSSRVSKSIFRDQQGSASSFMQWLKKW